MAFKFTDENFKTEALEADMPVLVDFYAEWCGPCKMMSPIIDALAKDFEGIAKVGKLNVDESPNTAGEYRVMSIPTILLIKNGVVVDTIIGATSKDVLAEKINEHK